MDELRRRAAQQVWGTAFPPSTAPATARVELLGTHLRVSGLVEQGRFPRLSDYVNALEGFFQLKDVMLLTRLGEATRIVLPELRVRLDDIALVGQKEPEPSSPDEAAYIPKQARRLVVMTAAHIVYGTAYLHAEASLERYIDTVDPRFVPMTNVRVRWLADRRLAGRYLFALLQRRHIIGVATEAHDRERQR